VRLHDNTRLVFEDDSSSYIVSNNNSFQIINTAAGTTGTVKLSSNKTELHNTGGTLEIVNNTTSITTSNLLATVGNVSINGIDSMTLNGHTNGSVFLTNTTHVRHKDPIVTLAFDNHTSNDGKDRGIEYEYYSTSEKLGWFGWKNTTGRFTFYSDATNTNEVISGTLGSIELANIFIDQDIVFSSGGNLNLNCGDILNVHTIYGCMGDLTLHASNNTTVSTGTLDLVIQNSININTFIYKKYKIDSLTYYQNQRYYAADIVLYKQMHQEVLDRLEKLKKETELLPQSIDSVKKPRLKTSPLE
jgi:hypothetical protein